MHEKGQALLHKLTDSSWVIHVAVLNFVAL